MTDTAHAAAVAVVAAPPASRWPVWLQAVLGTVGALIAVGGLLIVVGKVLARVDVLERDMTTVKLNQATYIPVLVGMQTDIKYLADSRRRDDRRGDHGEHER